MTLFICIIVSIVASAVFSFLIGASIEYKNELHRKRVDGILTNLQTASKAVHDTLQTAAEAMTGAGNGAIKSLLEHVAILARESAKATDRIEACEERLRTVNVDEQKTHDLEKALADLTSICAELNRRTTPKPVTKKPQPKPRSKSEVRRIAVQKGEADKKV